MGKDLLLGHIRTEGKLLLRGPMLWLGALAAGGLAWLILRLSLPGRNLLHIAEQFSFLYTGPLSIGATIAGVYGARRDEVLRTGRLLHALPYRSGLLQAVRFGMLAVPFAALNLVPAGILLWQWQAMLGRSAGIGELLAVETALSLGMLFPVALGWMTGTLVTGRIGYFAGFLGWMVCCYGVLFLMPHIGTPWYGLPNVMLLDVVSMGFMDSSWGFLSDGTFWLQRLFGLALTGVLLAGCILVAGRRRREPAAGLRRVRAAGLLGLAVMLAAGAGYGKIRERRVAGYERWTAQVQAQSAAALAETAEAGGAAMSSYTVQEYRLRVVQGEDGKLTVTAGLVLGGGSGGSAAGWGGVAVQDGETGRGSVVDQGTKPEGSEAAGQGAKTEGSEEAGQSAKLDGSEAVGRSAGVINSGPVPERMLFTLHPDWTVMSAELNGVPLRAERDGYRLALSLMEPAPDLEGAKLELVYAGKPENWRVLQPYGNPGDLR